MQRPPLILASTSPYRRQLLQQLGMDFIWVAPQLEETSLPGEPPIETARRLAREKAGAVFAEHKHAVVIGSDQVADLDGQALGKPLSEEKAFEQLGVCSGRTLWFHTGVAVISARGTDTEVISTRVEFRQMSERQIHSYIRKEAALDCAGSFKCEGLGICLFERINSDDPTALIGLPLISLTRLLLRHGLDPLNEQGSL